MFQKLKNWLCRKPLVLDISSVEEWDTEKSEFIYHLLSERYDEEKDIAKSLKTRAVFLISVLGVILTIIFTLIGSNISEISKWDIITQLAIGGVLGILGCSIIIYFYLYMALDSPKHIPPNLTDQQLESISGEQSQTKKQLLDKQIVLLFRNILKAHKENLDHYYLFKAGDSLFYIGAGIAVIYAFYVSCNSPYIFATIIMAILFVIYIIMFVRILLDIPQAIRNIYFLIKKASISSKIKNILNIIKCKRPTQNDKSPVQNEIAESTDENPNNEDTRK
jgi:MFS family permease